MGMGRMRRMVLLTGAAAVFAASGFAPASDYASGEAGILRSATYYSDDWVVNFWNSESVNMEQELLQIAQDGFNNIILCIPWREFQPQLTPAAYNDYAWDKLERVMEAAKKQNLSVMLRVGYTWDYGAGFSMIPTPLTAGWIMWNGFIRELQPTKIFAVDFSPGRISGILPGRRYLLEKQRRAAGWQRKPAIWIMPGNTMSWKKSAGFTMGK